MIENQQTSVGGMENLVGGMENYYVMVFNNKRLLQDHQTQGDQWLQIVGKKKKEE